MTYKNKPLMTKKRAFTLIELLIVIAIIGILFVVLVSKVDFATDKAKATGVQTDFRSFQVAFDTVAKENAGFNTFGWDTGDTNGDKIRNSYDAGDANQDGIKQDDEVWTGRKVYAETWTGIYTLVKPGTTDLDADAIFALESAINKNLDPKLHIAIGTDGKIIMANGAQDPWKTEYHGVYISNAANDKKDRGALIIYSNGANQEFGSEHSIANGIVSIIVPGNNIYGQDDMSIVSCYTYTNGYGEVKNMTTGFSNNQGFLSGNNGNVSITPEGAQPIVLEPGLYETGTQTLTMSWDELISAGILNSNGAVVRSARASLVGDLRLPESLTSLPNNAYLDCQGLTGVYIPETLTTMGINPFAVCPNITTIVLEGNNPSYKIVNNCILNKTTNSIVSSFRGATIPTDASITKIEDRAFWGHTYLTNLHIPANITTLVGNPFADCDIDEITVDANNPIFGVVSKCLVNLQTSTLICGVDSAYAIDPSITTVASYAFWGTNVTSLSFNISMPVFEENSFAYCTSLGTIVLNNVSKDISRGMLSKAAQDNVNWITFSRRHTDGSRTDSTFGTPSFTPYG